MVEATAEHPRAKPERVALESTYECPSSSKALGHDATEVVLSRAPRATAVLATSAELALGVIEAARERGLSVPSDLSVVGFDDVREAALVTPPLTAVR